MRAPLQWAAMSRWESATVIPVLLEGGANPNGSSGGTATPMQILIEQMIPGAVVEASPERQFGEGTSEAVLAKHKEVCESGIAALVAAGADAAQALKSCAEELAGGEELTESRAGVLKDVMTELVYRGASPNLVGHLVRVTYGNCNFEPFARHMFSLGADATKDMDGSVHTAYIEVAECAATQRISISKAKGMLAFIAELSGQGDNCHQSAKMNGNTSLHHVIQGTNAASLAPAGRVDLLHALITLASSDVNSRDARGCTPLQVVATVGDVAIAGLLLELMARPNDRGAGSEPSPLQIAVSQDNLPLAAVLLRHGAQMPNEDDWGKPSFAMNDLLRQRGAKVSLHDATDPAACKQTPGKTALSELISAIKQDPGSPLKTSAVAAHRPLGLMS